MFEASKASELINDSGVHDPLRMTGAGVIFKMTGYILSHSVLTSNMHICVQTHVVLISQLNYNSIKHKQKLKLKSVQNKNKN